MYSMYSADIGMRNYPNAHKCYSQTKLFFPLFLMMLLQLDSFVFGLLLFRAPSFHYFWAKKVI